MIIKTEKIVKQSTIFFVNYVGTPIVFILAVLIVYEVQPLPRHPPNEQTTVIIKSNFFRINIQKGNSYQSITSSNVAIHIRVGSKYQRVVLTTYQQSCCFAPSIT